MLQETINEVFIEGVLNKKEFRRGDIDGKEYIAGTIEIKVDEDNIIPIEVFSYKYKKDGTENGVYKGFETVEREYVSVVDVPNPEMANKVRVNRGQIRVDEFSSKDGQIATAVKYTTNFINRIKSNNFNPKAEFEVEVIIKGFRNEIIDGEETGNGFVDAYIVNYVGDLKHVTFKAPKEIFNKLQMKVEPNEVLVFVGNIVNSVITKKIIQEMDFGKDQEKVITFTVRERVITGAKYSNREIVEEDLKNAFKQRAKFIEALKDKRKFTQWDTEEKEEDLPF